MRTESLRGSLLVAAALLLPLNVEFVLLRDAGYNDLQHRVSLFLFDFPLIALAVLTPWTFRPSWLRPWWGPLRWLGAVLLALTAVALAFHFSARGVQVMGRLIVNVAVPAIVLPTLSRQWARRVVLALIVGAVLEGVLGLAQSLRNETLGLTFLGENPPLRPSGNELSAKGTFVHPYMLVGFAAVVCAVIAVRYLSTRHWGYLVAMVGAALSFGVTHSRMGVLAAAGIATGLLLVARRDRAAVVAVAALLLGGVCAGLLTWGGWTGRVEDVIEVDKGVDAVTNERVTFTREARDLIRDDPFLGVGPGRYVIELERRQGRAGDVEVRPVHNVPLLIAAESGVPAGLVAAALLVGLGWCAWRKGGVGLGLYAAYLPFLAFDHFPYDNFQGLALTGLWLGLLIRMLDGPRPDEAATDDEAGRADAQVPSPSPAASRAGA